MPLSLRTKLILTMSAVVAGATIGTSVLTQGYVRRMYQQKFEDDFKAEVRYFSGLQLDRLAEIRKRCRQFSTSGKLADAVSSRDLSKIKSEDLGVEGLSPACGPASSTHATDSDDLGAISFGQRWPLGPARSRNSAR